MEVDLSSNKISTGSPDINKFLSGGYDKDIITTIYGPAGSGKTNFCMSAAVSQLKRKKKVIFIDTEGGFSIERFNQIALENQSTLLENLLILKPTSFEEQWKAFGELLKELKNDKESKIGLIIVDGITMLYRLELAEAKEEKLEENKRNNINEINSLLARQMRLLAEITRKKNIPVIITNQVYSKFLSDEELKAGEEKQVSMVGGDILKYWSKCIIELKNERGKRKAILRKHRYLPEKELEFEISNQGIRKRGWI
jgi:DNA repair protein RadB